MSDKPIKEIETVDLSIEIYKDGHIIIEEADMDGDAVDVSKEDMELIIKEYKKLIKK